MNPCRLIVAICLAAAGTTGCEAIGFTDALPTQSFSNPLEVLGKDAGRMRGQILFPSEYTQRSVTFHVDGLPFVTHPDGRYSIDWILPGSHLLSVQVKGFQPAERIFTLEPDGDLHLPPLRLRLARGQVFGRLVFNTGKSASGILLQLVPMGGFTASDNDGIFKFIGVSSGGHDLVVEDNDYFAVIKPFVLRADESRNLGLIQVERRARPEPGIIGFNGLRP